jgi:hypothetical protein
MMQSCPAWKTQNTEPKPFPERQITGHERYGLKTTVESGSSKDSAGQSGVPPKTPVRPEFTVDSDFVFPTVAKKSAQEGFFGSCLECAAIVGDCH